jgi:hypothetical protein
MIKFRLNILIRNEDDKDFVILCSLTVHVYHCSRLVLFISSLGPKEFRSREASEIVCFPFTYL